MCPLWLVWQMDLLVSQLENNKYIFEFCLCSKFNWPLLYYISQWLWKCKCEQSHQWCCRYTFSPEVAFKSRERGHCKPRQLLITVSHTGLVCVFLCVFWVWLTAWLPPAVLLLLSRFNGLTARNCDGNLNDAPAVRHITAEWNQKHNWNSELHSHKV